MQKFLALAASAGLLVACSSGGGGGSGDTSPSPSPSAAATTRPTQELTYGAGTADVTATGGENVTFTAQLDPEQATFSPDDGFDVWWRTGGQALNLSGDVKNGEPDVFVRIETAPAPGHAYVDPFHTQCDVTVTTFDDSGLAGTFTCPELLAWGDEESAPAQPVGATGTFMATVVYPAGASPS